MKNTSSWTPNMQFIVEEKVLASGKTISESSIIHQNIPKTILDFQAHTRMEFICQLKRAVYF
jgi:hypothetical protein